MIKVAPTIIIIVVQSSYYTTIYRESRAEPSNLHMYRYVTLKGE